MNKRRNSSNRQMNNSKNLESLKKKTILKYFLKMKLLMNLNSILECLINNFLLLLSGNFKLISVKIEGMFLMLIPKVTNSVNKYSCKVYFYLLFLEKKRINDEGIEEEVEEEE